MKKIISTICSLIIVLAVSAQVPDVMNYQAVARNNAGVALANQTIKVRLTINKNAVPQYSETRQVTTNALGLFNVQIGSAGALSTTGSFSGINWQDNAAPGYVLKVELDISNSNVFTDMGSQALVTVPYSFATKKADQATETVNIAGRPLDVVTVPAAGSRLSWNGTNWTPVKKDVVILSSGSVPTTAAGGSGAPWGFANPSGVATVTVTGTETIVAALTASFGHLNAGVLVPVSVSVCYQNTAGGSVTPFYPLFYSDTQISSTGDNLPKNSIILTASGAITLPAGTYKIGFGIRNYHTTQSLNNNQSQNGFIEVKY